MKFPAVKSRSNHAFSLIELLVTIGIVTILLSLLAPTLQQARQSGMAAKNANNIKEMSRGLMMYAQDNDEYPPTFGPPAWPPQGPWKFDFASLGSGNWFEHVHLYALAITAYLDDTRIATAPGRPDGPHRTWTHKGRQASYSDYYITAALYAQPEFFNWDTHLGPSQFAPQRLTSVAHPSQKGLLFQSWIYHLQEFGPFPACCVIDVPSPVVFADMSVSEHILKRMKPGIYNHYAHHVIAPGADPRDLPGTPVENTINGVLGVDRD